MALKIQTHLQHGTTHMMTWLDPDPRVKVGSIIELQRMDDILWEVIWQSKPAVAGEQRKWGLDLPKSQRTER